MARPRLCFARPGGRWRGRGGARRARAASAGRMKLFNGSRPSFIRSISRSIRSICAWTMRRVISLGVNLGRGRDVGAEVEQLVLDRAKHRLGRRRPRGARRRRSRYWPHRRRRSPAKRMSLGDARAVGKSGFAAVAGAGVDLVEPDQGALVARAPATTSSRMTMTIAIAWNRTRLRIHFCCCSPVTSLPDAIAITPRTST